MILFPITNRTSLGHAQQLPLRELKLGVYIDLLKYIGSGLFTTIFSSDKILAS